MRIMYDSYLCDGYQTSPISSRGEIVTGISSVRSLIRHQKNHDLRPERFCMHRWEDLTTNIQSENQTMILDEKSCTGRQGGK